MFSLGFISLCVKRKLPFIGKLLPSGRALKTAENCRCNTFLRFTTPRFFFCSSKLLPAIFQRIRERGEVAADEEQHGVLLDVERRERDVVGHAAASATGRDPHVRL